MKEGKNGVVAAADKATLPNEGVVAPEVEVTKETAVELAAPNKGDSGSDCAVAKEEETEDNIPKEGEGRGAVDGPNPNRSDAEPPPVLGFVTAEVAGAAAEMEGEMLERESNPWLGKEEWVVDKELLKENDEAGPEEKLKVDVLEEEGEVTVAAAGVDIELNEDEKGDDAANKLLVAAMDELGFDEELNRDDDELKENAVDEEEKEEPNGINCEAEVTAEPKEKDGVWLADAAVAEEDAKIGEAAEDKENGEEVAAKELEEEKENPGDWEDDKEDVAGVFKEKDDAIQIRDELLPLCTVSSSLTTIG